MPWKPYKEIFMTKDELKKQIIADAKAEGLEVAEDAAERIAIFALKVVDRIVNYTDNTYDDMVWGAVKTKAQEIVLELVDKIDG